MSESADKLARRVVQRRHDTLLVAALAVLADHINALGPPARLQRSFQYRVRQGRVPIRRIDQRGRAPANFTLGETEGFFRKPVPADDAILNVGDDDRMR